MIPEISQLLKSSVEECLEDEIAVSFSGGLDSGLITHISKKLVKVYPISVGTEDSPDIEYSIKSAEELKVNLEKVIIDEQEILDLYSKVYQITKSNFLKLEILIPIYKSVLVAKEKGLEAILIGSGAEELFVGYNRYYTYFNEGKDLDTILKEEFKTLPGRDVGMITKIIRKVGLEPRFPFMNKKLSDYVFSIPLEKRMEDKELKKGLLREAGKLLGLPQIILNRKKKAAQYGSGVHKILMRHSDELNEKYPANSMETPPSM